MTQQQEAIAPAEEERTRPSRRRSSSLAIALGASAAVIGAALVGGVLPAGGSAGVTVPRAGPEAPATAMDMGVGFANNSPLLLADPTEPLFVVLANRLDAPDFSCALEVSGDGGRSWEPAAPVLELPPEAEKCYAPEVAFDKRGVLYYLFIGLAGEGNEPVGVFLTTSTDRARTFTPPRQVLGPLNFAARMAIDPSLGERGRIHIVWLHATSDPPLGGFGPPPNPILAAHSDDGGKTFSEPVQVSDPARQRVVAPGLALGPDHAVHVAYYDLGDDARDYQNLEGPVWEDNWSLVSASSFDGGGRFGKGVVVDSAVIPTERVMLIFTMPPPALVAHEKRVCAAWTDARYGDADALLNCSTDRGRSWGELRRLNDDQRGNGRRQYMPRLSISPDGRLDAIFFDRRGDPQNTRNDVSYTFSVNGGDTFAANRTISRESFDVRIGAQYAGPGAEGQYEIGSRLGLLSRRSDVLAAWPDTRNSRFGTTAQSVFTTVVDLPPAQSAQRVARLLGAGLLVSGLLVIARAASRRRESAVDADATRP